MRTFAQRTGIALTTAAIALGGVVATAPAASAAAPGTRVFKPYYGLTCDLWTTTTLGYTRGAPSCWTPSSNPSWSKWQAKVTCTDGSVSWSSVVNGPAGAWSSTTAGWCWGGVRDINIVEIPM
ncbi:hypothetical protein AB0K02_31980 [Streptomyces sp. NPDC049597]|uniref:hypothetical protein n=1 Tax=Streptomyces sp. NPDC049597 TaxID=3155276 RepID=UPI00342A7DB2